MQSVPKDICKHSLKELKLLVDALTSVVQTFKTTTVSSVAQFTSTDR